jgi:hypothetical protein
MKNRKFYKNGKKLSAIYSIAEEVEFIKQKEETPAIEKKRIALFPVYNSGTSFCYYHSKPISKMMYYEPKNI